MKDINTINDIRELAGLAPVVAKKIDEGVVGGFSSLSANGYEREETELDRWIKLMDDTETDSPTNLTESIDDELNDLEESIGAPQREPTPKEDWEEDDEEETYEDVDIDKATKDYDSNLSEEVEGDLSNGYGEQNDANGEDYFPSGATSPVAKRAGPASGKHGDNPLQKDMSEVEVDDLTEAKAVHRELVYAYRAFLGE